ncbi:MAG: DoxX family protein [Pseudomonadota bacterium]
MRDHHSHTLMILGRAGLASLFILGGINKCLNYSVILAGMQEQQLEPAPLLLPFVIAIELAGGAIVATGHRWILLAGPGLAAFTLATNFTYHDFWNQSGLRAELELSMFFKNLSIAGGLLLATGAALRTAIR